MSRVAVVHERQADGAWKAVGVLGSTPDGVEGQFLPDEPDWDRWLTNLPRVANPPYRDGVGFSVERGTWDDWIVWAANAFTNGHVTWITLLDEPEPTLVANFERYVLGRTGAESSSGSSAIGAVCA